MMVICVPGGRISNRHLSCSIILENSSRTLPGKMTRMSQLLNPIELTQCLSGSGVLVIRT